MRTLLITGPGGAGRTTLAAATAVTAARAGQRTLLLTAADVGGAVSEGVPGLTVRRVDGAAHFRDELLALQERAATALDLFGAHRLEAEELTELPGAEQLALLRAVREAAAQGPDATELLVVDLPASTSALALLALPEQLRRYLRRLLPPERRAARALRPVLAQLAGVPMPARWLFESAGRWDEHLAAVDAVLRAEHTAVRLVAEPGPAGADALRTTALGLALHRLPIEALAANRVLPQDSPDPWLAGLAAQQQKTLAEWRDRAYAPLHEVAHLGRDPRGPEDLAALGAPAPDPAAPAARPDWPVEDRLADDGGSRVFVWHIPLPGAVREELDLLRRGDELVVTAGPFRRIVPLPSALRRCTVAGAGLREGALRVRFVPDPELWPRTR
ncbi:ArsA family ATPase [Streptomyces sp. NPDC002851]